MPVSVSAVFTATRRRSIVWRCVTWIACECVVRVRRAESGVAIAICTARLLVRRVRTFRRVFRGVVCRVGVVVAFLLRIRIGRVVVSRVGGRRREVVAAWVGCLRLVIADRVVRWRVLIRGVRLAVIVVVACESQ